MRHAICCVCPVCGYEHDSDATIRRIEKDWPKIQAKLNSHDKLVAACEALLEVSACRSLSFVGGRGAVQSPAIHERVGKIPAMQCDCCVCEAAQEARVALAAAKGGQQ